ncbi:hypothetical protein BDW22DRAFT_53935 [Trametopsis cervina]|nr:hypothetical protein BDW22DRAFT_53935 [Trametopsis cervina]
MSEDALSIVVIVLGIAGIISLGALLGTPAPKHAIVKTFVVTTLVRAILGVVTAILFEVMPENFNNLPHELQHTKTKAFCTASAIILRYLSLTMSAFSVSFTLPLLYLSIKYAGDSASSERSRAGNQVFYRRTTFALAFGPFVWALPAILAPLPQLVHDVNSVKPQFTQAICTIQDPIYEILCLTFTITALALALLFALIFIYFLWKTIRLPLFSQSLGLFDITRLLRFAVLLCIFFISVTLYSIWTASWVSSNDLQHPKAFNFLLLAKLAIIWESVTPMLYFVIFAAHEEVFTVWSSWCRGTSRAALTSTSRGADRVPSVASSSRCQPTTWWQSTKQKFTGSHHGSEREPGPPSPVSHSAQGFYPTEPEGLPMLSVPGRIIQQPMLNQNSSSSHHKEPTPSETPGLLPPPRPVKSPSFVSQDGASPTTERSLINMPSLTALGGRESPASQTPSSGNEGGSAHPNKRSTRPRSSRPSTGDTFGHTRNSSTVSLHNTYAY